MKSNLLICLAALLFITSCSKTDSGSANGGGTKSSDAKLYIFDFRISANSGLLQDVTGIINESAKTVILLVPPFTNVTNLVTSFGISPKASASIGGAAQQTGITANNFTTPLTLTVTAEDGTRQTYTITVTVAQSNAAKITSFLFKKLFNPALAGDYPATIDEVNKQVTVTLPMFTPVNNLVASFTLSQGAMAKINAVAQVTDVTANNFSVPIRYTVIAQDGTAVPYTITVTVL